MEINNVVCGETRKAEFKYKIEPVVFRWSGKGLATTMHCYLKSYYVQPLKSSVKM